VRQKFILKLYLFVWLLLAAQFDRSAIKIANLFILQTEQQRKSISEEKVKKKAYSITPKQVKSLVFSMIKKSRISITIDFSPILISTIRGLSIECDVLIRHSSLHFWTSI